MQGKIDLFDVGGGDRVQIENTALELRRLGVNVDIIPGFSVDYKKYDLIHLFQLDWTPETYLYAKKVHMTKKPLVLSPIHHNISEVAFFDTVYTFDFRRLSKLLFHDQFKRDTLKNVYKVFFDKRKAYPTFVSMLVGLKKMQQRTLKWADYVLVQTNLEAQDLKNTYDVDFKWLKVPNGVGEQFLKYDKGKKSKNLLNFENYILCVGRIEARKNQISIIKAVEIMRDKENIDYKLVFVGAKSSLKHFEYIHSFDKMLKSRPWVTHLTEIPYGDMPSVYAFAKVCVSASWFETTGLTSLEALFCNTNAVASGKRAAEYLGDYVSYCKPNDIESIANAISNEYKAERPHMHSDLRKEYTWANAARETLRVYKELL